MQQYIDMAKKKAQEDLASGDPARVATANQIMAKVQQLDQHYSQPSAGSSASTPFSGLAYLQKLNQNNPWAGMRPMASVQRDDQANQFQQNFDRGVLENDRTFGLQQSGVTGMYNGQQTMDAKNQALANALNVAGVTGLYQNKPTIQGKLANSTIAENQSQSARGWASISADKEDRAYKRGQDAIENTSKSLNSAISNIDSLYVYKDPTTGANQINTNGLRSYILSLNLPDDSTTSLLRRYGVQ